MFNIKIQSIGMLNFMKQALTYEKIINYLQEQGNFQNDLVRKITNADPYVTDEYSKALNNTPGYNTDLDIQPCNYQLNKSIVHEIKFCDIAVM